MWIVDGAQIKHRRLPTFALGMTNSQHNEERAVCCLLTVVWFSSKNAPLPMHMMCCGVACLILHVDTIFDNTIGGFSTEFDVDSSMESTWNPHGLVPLQSPIFGYL